MRPIYLAVLISMSTAYPPLRATTVADIQADIVRLFQFPASGTFGIPCNPCAFGDILGALVRLPFHDALGGGRLDGKGGPNGCIDFSSRGNDGLQEVVGQLRALYDEAWSTALSFADFIVIAGNMAIVAATTIDGEACCGLTTPKQPLVLPFRHGRIDDASCDGVDAPFLPSPHNSYAETSANFVSRVGMTHRQLVAIMGAHSLGRCEKQNSGFSGGWTGFQSTFSNHYFQSLAGQEWDNKDAPKGSWSANAPGGAADPPLVMLKGSDVEIMITPSEDCPAFNELNFTLRPLESYSIVACPLNPRSEDAIRTFISSLSAFWAEFAQAWQVMTEFTYEGQLHEPAGKALGAADVLRMHGAQ